MGVARWPIIQNIDCQDGKFFSCCVDDAEISCNVCHYHLPHLVKIAVALSFLFLTLFSRVLASLFVVFNGFLNFLYGLLVTSLFARRFSLPLPCLRIAFGGFNILPVLPSTDLSCR